MLYASATKVPSELGYLGAMEGEMGRGILVPFLVTSPIET